MPGRRTRQRPPACPTARSRRSWPGAARTNGSPSTSTGAGRSTCPLVVADRAGLRAGVHLTAERQQELIDQDAPYRARERALRLLGAAGPVSAGDRDAASPGGVRGRRWSAATVEWLAGLGVSGRPAVRAGCTPRRSSGAGGGPGAVTGGAGGQRGGARPSWRRRWRVGRSEARAGPRTESAEGGERPRAALSAGASAGSSRPIRRRPSGGWPASSRGGATTGRPLTAMAQDAAGSEAGSRTTGFPSIP